MHNLIMCLNAIFLFTTFTLIVSANSEKLIIIGAGAAGIAAATRLLESGYNDLLILEAENRIGGRVHTIPFGANVVDIGGQWCHGDKGNVVYELAAPLNLLEKSAINHTYQSFIKVYGTDFNSSTISDITIFYNKFFDNDLENDSDSINLNQTLGEFMTHKFYDTINNDNNLKYWSDELKMGLLDYVHKSVLLSEAAFHWDNISLQSHFYTQLNADSFYLWEWKGKGYKTILDVLMKKIPDSTKELSMDGKILLDKEVNKVEWNNDDNQVNVYCSDGTNYKADKVLTTVSIGVLKNKHTTLFSPQLPESKQNAINEIEMGTEAKLILLFNKPWWPDTVDHWKIIWTNTSKTKFVQHFSESDLWLLDISDCHLLDHQPNILMCWLSTESIRTMEELDENIVKEKLMKLLHFLFDSDYNNITEPIDFQRSKWLTNPHFYGSYSYHGLKSTNMSPDKLATPVVNMNGNEVIYFGGEATSHQNFANVHGAVESGWREADRILKQNVLKNNIVSRFG